MAVAVLRKVGGAGTDRHRRFPRSYGGMELDLASAMVVAEHLARDGSYAGWHGAHIGHRHAADPVLRHRGAEAEVPAEAGHGGNGRRLRLTEPHAGSDALAAQTRADLSPTARTTSSTARRCGSPTAAWPTCSRSSPRWTARSSRRSWWSARSPASPAAPKKRRWASRAAPPRPSIFDNVQVPVENVLGEIGRGHIIAFNILNIGRLKLGPFAVGGAKNVLAHLASSTPRSARRSARPSREFGMIQHKLAEMAIRIFAAEIDELPRGRPDRGAARGILLGAAGRRARRC